MALGARCMEYSGVLVARKKPRASVSGNYLCQWPYKNFRGIGCTEMSWAIFDGCLELLGNGVEY